ncbi:MAG: glycosyltransferase [Trueperaceae bacterium]|nr:glycosyltransferase [Trueperaceae bacterium]
MDAPWVSVITATIGRRAAMLAKLDALRAQTLPPERFEWVVVADGDDDGTLAAIAAAAPPFRLRTLRLPRRSGAATARNAAVAAARGGVLLFSDDDCVPDDDNLERHWRAQEAAAAPTAMVGSLTFVAEDGGATSWRPRRVGYWNLNGANASLPAAAFAAAGGFDEGLEGYGGEDVLLGYELHRSGVRFRALPGAHARHLGPDPAASGDASKARSAGRNAVRIAGRRPELRDRLGVRPALLHAKRAVLPWLAWLGPRVAGDLAYVEGALDELRGRAEAPARDRPGGAGPAR